MDWWLWLLVGCAVFIITFVVSAVIWATVTLFQIARGDYGDLTDLN